MAISILLLLFVSFSHINGQSSFNCSAIDLFQDAAANNWRSQIQLCQRMLGGDQPISTFLLPSLNLSNAFSPSVDTNKTVSGVDKLRSLASYLTFGYRRFVIQVTSSNSTIEPYRILCGKSATNKIDCPTFSAVMNVFQEWFDGQTISLVREPLVLLFDPRLLDSDIRYSPSDFSDNVDTRPVNDTLLYGRLQNIFGSQVISPPIQRVPSENELVSSGKTLILGYYFDQMETKYSKFNDAAFLLNITSNSSRCMLHDQFQGFSWDATDVNCQSINFMSQCNISPLVQSNDSVSQGIVGTLWSWDYGQPVNDTSNRCAIQQTNSRWKATICASTFRVACQSSTDPLTWAVSQQSTTFAGASDACPSGFYFSVPKTSAQNIALASLHPTSAVWLNYNSNDYMGCWMIGSQSCPFYDKNEVYIKIITISVSSGMAIIVMAAAFGVYKHQRHKRCAKASERSREARERVAVLDSVTVPG